MAALMSEGAGALLSTDAEDKPRIRVRLHFGGTFAQDGPRQWRYVGGEVYNESFPLDSKYADVSKRLNDKFGDTVSFKYLCPGDDIDPDNLVQVQGDDDLREMCDEYRNALQKSSTPVKTVRIKVFVFRAVIFEREVQELDEELCEEDELLDLPDDGLLPEPLSSCDHAECGPNWSDWGEPDEQEVTQSSIPSAPFSSDTEQHISASAAAAATALLHNTSMSALSVTSGRTATNSFPGPSAALGVGAGSKASGLNMLQFGKLQHGVPAHLAQQQYRKQTSANMGSGDENGSAARSGSGSSGDCVRNSLQKLGASAAAAAAAATTAATAPYPEAFEEGEVAEEGEASAYGGPGVSALADPFYAERQCAAYGFTGVDEVDEQLYEELYDEERGLAADEEELVYDDADGVYAGEGHGHGQAVHQQEQQRPLHQERLGVHWTGVQEALRSPGQGDWDPDRERGPERSRLEQQQTQERQQTHRQQEQQASVEQQQTQQTQERQNLDSRRGGMSPQSGIGFYCDEELEDPYGDPYNDDDGAAAAAGAGIRDMHLADVTGARRSRNSAASDGALGGTHRAVGMAAYGEHAAAHHGATVAGAAGLLAGRLPAVADLLPRHISAFGESSRDDSQGGGASGPLLPSRITIFGDDESLTGTHGGGGGGSAGGRNGGVPASAGGLHRLALVGVHGAGGGVGPWPVPNTAFGDAGGVKSSTAGLLCAGEDLAAGDSRLCITQEFGNKARSSVLDLGDHSCVGGSAGEGGGAGGLLAPLGLLDPMSRAGAIGLGGLGAGLGGLGPDGMDGLSPSAAHNHPLKGVVKKRKSEVSIMAKIGEGAFGEVSQAQVFPYGIVAIKWLKRERFAKYSESFQREAETLAKLNHPNIIRMYGLVMDTPDAPPVVGGSASTGGAAAAGGAACVPQAQGPGAGGGSGGGSGGNASGTSGTGTPTGLIGGIITEFVRNGSLGQYLRSLGGRRLSLRQRAMIALQASLGMAYLHEQSPAVVHFDLKPDNLLVDGEGDSMVIKVADFGLSKHKLSNYVSCRDLRGTLPYMAYELVSGNGNISEKIDVYSMGVVMWEMYTVEVPFAHLTAQEILTGLLHGNLHLAIPPACEPEWRSLVETCMDPNPSNRPSFQELAMQLQEILRLERQASNASSVSAAAAAAAVAAVLESDGGTTPVGDSSGGAAAAAAAAAVAAHAGGPAVGGGLAQWRLPTPMAPPPVVPGHPQVRSPGAGHAIPPAPPPLQAPQALLARQQQLQAAAAAAQQQQQQQQNPLSPPLHCPPALPPQHPLPLLIPLPQQQHHHSPPPQQPQTSPQGIPPLMPPPPHYGNVPYAVPTAVRQPTQAVPPPPQQPAQPTPPPLHYLQQFVPGLLLQQQQQQQQQQQPQQQPGPLTPAHLYALPLRPQALFNPPPAPQQHGQHINGLYGMGGGVGVGVGGGGLPPLVSWGDRGM